jgi:GNAT superfamily N-acetyltransferase
MNLPKTTALLETLTESRKVELVTSPGRGQRLSGKGAKRLQLVDPKAPPAQPNDNHFFYKEITRRRGRGGKPLKRPKRELHDPGADPNVVAFVDYWVTGSQVKIDLIVVRGDYRRKGLAKKLLDALYSRHRSAKIIHWGKVLNHKSWALMQFAQEKYKHVTTIGAKYF